MRFHHGGGFVVGVGEVGNRAKALLTVIIGSGVQDHVRTGHAHLHLDDFFALDVEVLGDLIDL